MRDLIERQAAIEVMEKESQVDGAYGYIDTKSIVDLLNNLPSAQPEQKKGRWLMKHDPYGFFEEIPVCSECGCTTKWRDKYPYCPSCGAKMDKGGDAK